MARPYNPYQDDKEKRDLASARTEDLKSKTAQREDNRYPQAHGFHDLKTMTEAETARERAATNQRLTENAATNSHIEALKAMAALDPGGPHGKAALDELARMTGVKVVKPVDPKQAALDKVKQSKGIPVETPQEQPAQATSTTQTQPQQDNQPYFQPEAQPGTTEGLVAPGTQPVPSGNREAGFGSPVTPHLGIGGAEITPENPTGDPRNPFGAGGLFDNPTHAAAMNVNAREAAAHPYGSDNSPTAINHAPGSPMDRLMGGSAPQPPGHQLPPSPAPAAPPLTNYTPSAPQFNPSQLVQPGPAGPRTPPNINVDLDALASHIGNWFSSQAQQVKQRTNY